MIRRNALVEKSNVRLLSLSNAYSVMVLENGSVGGLIVRFFELELYHSLVHILPSN